MNLIKQSLPTVLFVWIAVIVSNGQLVSITPAFPEATDEVTITFNASLGSGGLAGHTGDVYAHTGVITNQSSSSSDWKYVKTNWGQNTAETKLTRVSTDMYQFTLSPSIRNYYGVPSNETIQKIALVFRSGQAINGSYLEGKTSSGGDIFLDVFIGDGINIQLIQPIAINSIVDDQSTIPVEANVSKPAKIKFYENDILIDSLNTASSYSTNLIASAGTHIYKITAENADTIVETTFSYIVSQSPTRGNLPIESKLGPQYLGNDIVRLVLEAPVKQRALVHSNVADWNFNSDYWMNQTFDTRFFYLDIDISSLNGKPFLYQYIVDNEIVIADPISELILDRRDDQFIDENTFANLPDFPSKAMGLHVTVHEPFTYDWQINNFIRPKKEDLIIYEMLMRDFIHTHNYQNLIDTIYYLKELGINAIELMPVNEFEGNLSWGYNPSFQGAVDKYYGSPQKFKALIDVCHANGIAVIMDVVFNHVFSQSPLAQLYWDPVNFKPAANNKWLNVDAKHPFNVGYDVNHSTVSTQVWMDRVLKRWVEDYKIDGFRFDLSKGFTQKNNPTNVSAWGQYDASRIAILKRMADKLWTLDPKSYVILEHFAANNEEKELAEYGMMLWGNMNHNYTEAAMGYTSGTNSALAGGLASNRGWSVNHLITYMESHDEERMVYKNQAFGNSNGGYSTKDPLTSIARAELAANFFYLLPGPKMIWQFEELGFPYSINRCEDGTIDNNCRLSPKPIIWDFFEETQRRQLFDVTRDLIYLKKNYSVFSNGIFVHDLSSTTKSYYFENGDLAAVGVGNFDVNSLTMLATFPKTGTWYEYFSGEVITVNNQIESFDLAPGEYRLYLDQNIERLSVIDPIVAAQNIDVTRKHILHVYPNPVMGGSLTIEFDKTDIDIHSISLMSLNGATILDQSKIEKGSYRLTLNLPKELPAGIYVLVVNTDSGVVQKTIVVGL